MPRQALASHRWTETETPLGRRAANGEAENWKFKFISPLLNLPTPTPSPSPPHLPSFNALYHPMPASMSDYIHFTQAVQSEHKYNIFAMLLLLSVVAQPCKKLGD